MNRAWTRLLGALLAVAVLTGLNALSRVRYAADSADHAVVRLAWRMPGTPVRECRHRTAEEMARLPVHMREGEVCERRILPYLLLAAVDDRQDSVVIRAAGAREDRPLYVYREIPVAPGRHRIRVDFVRQGTPLEEAPHEEAAEPPHGEIAERPRAPARLSLDTLVTMGDRDIIMVTYEPERQQLVIRTR